MNFQYSASQLAELMRKDSLLADVIMKVGKIEQPIEPDLFVALTYAIAVQKLPESRRKTVWKALGEVCGEISAATLAACSIKQLQSCGLTPRKAMYLHRLADSVLEGELDLAELVKKNDEEVLRILTALPAIGPWTAEMLMIFSMNRMDVLSAYDKGIEKGLCLLYHHRRMTDRLYRKYRRRYSPYGTLAAFYLWKVASGEVAGIAERKPKKLLKIE